MSFNKLKRRVTQVIVGLTAVTMMTGCDTSVTAFNPYDGNNVEPETEVTTKYVPKYNQEAHDTWEKLLNESGYSYNPNKAKRLKKNSDGEYVEKVCVNPYCGCIDCTCSECECDDR